VAGVELDDEHEVQTPPAAPAHLHGPGRLFDIEEAAR